MVVGGDAAAEGKTGASPVIRFHNPQFTDYLFGPALADFPSLAVVWMIWSMILPG